ncbi:FGGY-family carbohydrate kinase [Saccharibacillus sp. CPCC 101409]|uniref:rhamnulokinase n=1 Tax=Saccharibacillus sp. CPCC 101409 TaxID=3058041 RepID=UPI0026720123|nr:FGGY-family carbohydrate kinase [Saccharibacillus sp. CPCC 101409]MDO3413379.1 FGGY-family carbohydrate kinase [Saccharibacillus sp. CPCC 101409]
MSKNVHSESERRAVQNAQGKRDAGAPETTAESSVETTMKTTAKTLEEPGGSASASVKNVLAVDLGASSGRVMLCGYDGTKLELREIHRFDNVPIEENGGLYWDADRLLEEIKTGIRTAACEGRPILSIGVDTWGVDYGWIGRDSRLLRRPHHYRDERMSRHAGELERRLPRAEQFRLTGNQPDPINTVYQLFADLEEEPTLRQEAARFLMMPDLLHYQLSGVMAAERTILSTGGLLEAGGDRPAAEVLERLGLPAALFAPPVPSGTVLGELRPELQAELGCGPLRVVAGASHDTASAVAAVPYGRGGASVPAAGEARGKSESTGAAVTSEAAGEDAAKGESEEVGPNAAGAASPPRRISGGGRPETPAGEAAGTEAVRPPRGPNDALPAAAFISCGTWSIAGIETPRPVLSEAAFRRGLTNEACFGGGSRLLKNITGLWLLQECRRHWNAAGEDFSHADLAALAEAAGPAAAVIDPDDHRFNAPGDMPERIRQYCRETGQPVPGSPGELVRVVLESLADAYGRAIDELESISGRAVGAVHLVGGGSRNRLLCRLTAERTGRIVIAGPVEASAAGSALVQLTALGELDFARRAEIVERSFPLERYLPAAAEQPEDVR